MTECVTLWMRGENEVDAVVMDIIGVLILRLDSLVARK